MLVLVLMNPAPVYCTVPRVLDANRTYHVTRMDAKLSLGRTHQLGIRGSVLLAGPLGGGVAAAPRPRTAFIVATVVPPMRLPLHSLCKAVQRLRRSLAASGRWAPRHGFPHRLRRSRSGWRPAGGRARCNCARMSGRRLLGGQGPASRRAGRGQDGRGPAGAVVWAER